MSDETMDVETVVPELQPVDMPIIFLSGEHGGKKGNQRTLNNIVTGIFLDDGTEVTDGCSYVSEWQDAENKRKAVEPVAPLTDEEVKALARQALKAENEALKQQLIDAQLLETNAALKTQLAVLNNV